jgi:hypothetical protein
MNWEVEMHGNINSDPRCSRFRIAHSGSFSPPHFPDTAIRTPDCEIHVCTVHDVRMLPEFMHLKIESSHRSISGARPGDSRQCELSGGVRLMHQKKKNINAVCGRSWEYTKSTCRHICCGGPAEQLVLRQWNLDALRLRDAESARWRELREVCTTCEV